MKKTTAILFLLLQAFSVCGYLLYFFEMHQAESAHIQAIDRQSYLHSELFEIKIALHLPYTTDAGFEPYHAAIQRNGTWYTTVARKISADTLTLLCLPNRERSRLGYFVAKANPDIETVCSRDTRLPAAQKIRLSDEYACPAFVLVFEPDFAACHLNHSAVAGCLSCGHTQTPDRPPQQA